jgi:hypothetical protein
MKSKLLLVVYFVILIIFNFSTIHPCTTFVLQRENSIIFGRNLDWFSGTGLAIVNPRNLEKIALVDSSQNPIKWVAKYGSITFNQIGRELPFGGINVAGLVVEHMTLDKTVYPSRDDRYPISAYQWIQFQLDNYSTIEEVISSDTLLRIEDTSVKIHFLICDRFGHAAVIEFLDGKMVCRTGKDLPVRALANSTYDESMKSYNNSGSMSSDLSLANFCSAAKQIDPVNYFINGSIIDYAFNTLKSVSQGIFTKWSIVYDITNMKIYFKIYETPIIDGEKKIFLKQPPYDPGTKIVDFKGLDFNCSEGAKILDLNCNYTDVVNQYLENYSTSINKEFISKAFAFYKGWGLNIEIKDEVIEYLAKYPESFKCIVGKVTQER